MSPKIAFMIVSVSGACYFKLFTYCLNPILRADNSNLHNDVYQKQKNKANNPKYLNMFP